MTISEHQVIPYSAPSKFGKTEVTPTFAYSVTWLVIVLTTGIFAAMFTPMLMGARKGLWAVLPMSVANLFPLVSIILTYIMKKKALMLGYFSKGEYHPGDYIVFAALDKTNWYAEREVTAKLVEFEIKRSKYRGKQKSEQILDVEKVDGGDNVLYSVMFKLPEDAKTIPVKKKKPIYTYALLVEAKNVKMTYEIPTPEEVLAEKE